MTIFVASFPLEYLFLKNAKASRGVISFIVMLIGFLTCKYKLLKLSMFN